MKKLFLFLLFLIGVTLSACSSSSDSVIQTVDSKTAIQMMKESDNYLIVDVRTSQEFDSGHIENAINIDNNLIQKANQPLAQLPDTDQTIFIYCRSGNRSSQAAKKLESLGYTSIIDFGGIQNWDGDLITQ